MKLKTTALIAEIAASVAVVISLALLILEVRENTVAIERQISANHFRQIFTPFLDPGVLISAMEKVKAVDGQEDYVQAFKSKYSMNDAEAYAWGNFLLTIWTEMQEDFTRNGPSDRLVLQIRALMVNPDIILFVENFRFSVEFDSYIERVMTEIGP